MNISSTKVPAALALAFALICQPFTAAAQDEAWPKNAAKPGESPSVDIVSGYVMNNMVMDCLDRSRAADSMRINKSFSDRSYLSAMIAHHEAAVDMAREILKNGKDERVANWAREIIDVQNSEINQMRQWLSTMGGEDRQAAEAMREAMNSMMRHKYSGDPDLNFVSMMIGHHAGGVEMAVGAVVGSEDRRVVDLSKSIIAGQMHEIVGSKDWLAEKEGKPAVY